MVLLHIRLVSLVRLQNFTGSYRPSCWLATLTVPLVMLYVCVEPLVATRAPVLHVC
jgi:hypothetical protein